MNVDYSDLSLSVMRDPQHRMARQRGALMASEYLIRQLARSPPQVIRQWLTTVNILDSESKISPLSSPLGTSPGS
jgi:hypothetical protein